MRSMKNKKALRGIMMLALLAAGCDPGAGTGLLELSLSADGLLPPEAASRLVFAIPGTKERTYTKSAFPPAGGGSLLLELPGLPAGKSPITVTVKAYPNSDCPIGEGANQVTIKGGARNKLAIVLSKSKNACGDGGMPVDLDASLDAPSDGQTNHVDGSELIGDAQETGGADGGVIIDRPDSWNSLRPEVADAPVRSETGTDVPQATGGIIASTGGIIASTGGIIASTGGVIANTGGITPNTGGITPSTGGITPSTGGITPSTGGITPSTGGVVASTGGAPGSLGCGKALSTYAPGTNTYGITSAGVARSYVITIPSGYDPTKAYRLVFAMHAMAGSAASISSANYYRLKPLDTEVTTLWVAPQGDADGTWRGGDKDHLFFQDLVTQLKTELCIDTSRIFAVGFSFGAMFTNSLAQVFQDTLRGVVVYATVDNNIYFPPNSGKPLAYFGVHGSSDGTCPIARGRSSRDRFVSNNGCTVPATVPEATTAGTHVCYDYQCPSSYPVKWCTHSGGHTDAPLDAGQSTSWVVDATWRFITQF